MTPPGNRSKKKNKATTGSKKPQNYSGGYKVNRRSTRQSAKDDAKIKEIEEHHKKIHAAAKEAQDAVKKALESMSDQTAYEEKYEE